MSLVKGGVTLNASCAERRPAPVDWSHCVSGVVGRGRTCIAAAPDCLTVFEDIRWVPAKAEDTDVVVYEE